MIKKIKIKKQRNIKNHVRFSAPHVYTESCFQVSIDIRVSETVIPSLYPSSNYRRTFLSVLARLKAGSCSSILSYSILNEIDFVKFHKICLWCFLVVHVG